MSTTRTHDQPTPGSGAGLPFLVLLGLILAIMAGLYSARMMRPAATNGAERAALETGAVLDAVVEVGSMDADGTLWVGLLTRRGDGYIHVGETLKLLFTPGVKFVMGGQDALKPGAVLQVHARADGRSLDASQVVFLTGYVKVE